MRKVFILALLILTLSALLTACGGGSGGGGGGSYTLSISPRPTNGNVQSVFTGINCGSGGSACSASFSGTVVLTATPDAGYTFAGWGGDCSSCGNLPICSINMDANKTCSANFTPSGGVAGTTWTLRDQRNPLKGVTYGNGLFVAVGDVGAILTSSDGVSWTQRTSGTSNWLRGVAYGNSMFVAVGWFGTILTSP